MLFPEKALVICLVALYIVLTIGSFANIFSPQLKIVLPRTFVINNPNKKINKRVRIIPNPGISIPTFFRNGEANPSRNLNKNLYIQKVRAIGTIASTPAIKVLLIN